MVSHSKHKQENHNDISIIHVEKFKNIYFIILVGDAVAVRAVHGRVMFTFSVLNVERNVSTSKALGWIHRE